VRVVCFVPFVSLLAFVSMYAAGVPSTGPPPFVEVAEAAGLRFVHDNGATGQYYLPEIMGSGAALFDYDGDGDLDAYLLQSGPLQRGGRPHTGSRLFRNDLGRDSPSALRFTDVTDAAGVALEKSYAMGAAVGDVDGDGDLDLYVTAFGSNTLFRNNGDGTFSDVTREAGVDDTRWSTSAAFVDHDRDGDLDLYVGNYVAFTVAGNKICNDPVGVRDYCAPAAWDPVPDRFFRNEGGGRFIEASDEVGITRAFGPALGVAVGDLDGDGWLDVYVANDAKPNQLWRNRGNGTFEDVALFSGTAVNAAGRPEGSMGIALADHDNDGDEDLFVTNLTGESHVLYVNDGTGGFEDLRTRAGVGAPTAPMTGFGTGWLDYDHDGLLDLFLANGAVNILERLRGQPQPFHQLNQLFHNEGGGQFREVTREAGPALALSEVSRGFAVGDVDNDGDLDVLVTNNAGPVRLLLNQTIASPAGPEGPTAQPKRAGDAPAAGPSVAGLESPAPQAGGVAAATGANGPVARPAAPGLQFRPSSHWLQIALRSASGNRRGAGARVGIVRKGQPTLWRRSRTDGSYLSASDDRVHVGLGASAQVDAIIVEWPDGTRERFTGAVDRIVTLARGSGQPARGESVR
jgi:enediyne biosynthesis protein E4